MAILDKNDEAKIKKYNEFVRSREHTSAMQDLNWGLVKSADWSEEAIYIEKNEKIIAAMMVLIRKVAKGFVMLYAPRGPVCDIYDTNIVDELMDDVNLLAKKYNAFVFKMDPEAKYDEKLKDVYKAKKYFVNGRNVSDKQLIQPRYNMILNLDGRNIDEIFSGYSEKTRYNIRVAIKKGVKVRYSRDEKDLKAFYDLSLVMAERDKIAMRPYEYFKKMLDAYGEDNLRIYIAEADGKVLSAALAIKYSTKLFYIYGASSNELRNYMPNYLMQHEMIQWGKENGCKEYDFGGVYELNKSNGLYKFKEGFCRQEGVTEFIGEIGKIYNKPKYFIFTKLLPIARKIMITINKFKNHKK